MTSNTSTAVFTIVSKNYLHFARTLMQSVKDVHPEWDRHVLLVDEVRGDFDQSGEDFTLTEVRELLLPQMDKFLFRYTILELNTAVKPWMAEWLFKNPRYERVVYIDPDIYLYSPMNEVEAALSNGSLMVLTPHLTGQLDEKHPDEQTILRAGSYNLGFIALSRHHSILDFLHWWQSKLEYKCIVDLGNGLFVDQKWMDLVPGMFPDVTVLRHEGYNVAYWNLFHRQVDLSKDGTFINGVPLVFFHFSGFDPVNPTKFSKHQNRYTLEDLPGVKPLALHYAGRVMANGYNEFKKMKYSFDNFTDGQKISDFARYAYRNSPEIQASAGDNPFEAQESILGNVDNDVVTPYMRGLLASRADLRSAFPDIDGRDKLNFAHWFVDNATAEGGVPIEYIIPVRKKLESIDQRVSKAGRLFIKIAETFGPPIVTRFPVAWREKVKSVLYGDAPTKEISIKTTAPESTTGLGVNIVGYVRSEHGVGESSRRCANSARAAAIPFVMCDFNVGNTSRVQDASFESYISKTNPHRVNLFHINADQIPTMASTLGREFLSGHYNIGFWHWELPEFPDRWCDAFSLLDEIWAPTRFVVEAVSAKSPIPVLLMPHAISIEQPLPYNRADFGLPKDEFLFLMMYDMSSFQARKNPQAVVKAFNAAFPDVKGVKLVIKTQNSHLHPHESAELRGLLDETPGLIHIDKTLTRNEIYGLENVCDSFVSLHRSEGFGLPLAECMYLGKPVIATGWSANADFMNHENSCPVHYKLVELTETIGPYDKGQMWAEPDVEHAARYMRKVYEDEIFRSGIAEKASAYMREHYNPRVIGNIYKKRLAVIKRGESS